MIERRTASATVAALLVFAIVACSTATPQTPGPTGSGTPTGVPGPSESEAPGADVPSRATLINAAVDEGRLDPVTGLLYRAYGLFGLPGLPDEFAAGFPRADDALLAEMVELMPTLSTEDQAKLRPFVVRPTDPDSIFAAAPAAMAGIGPIAQVPPPASPWTCRDWANSGTADTRFKVWACRDQDAAKADADIATISAMVTDIWEPMTKDEPDGMGPPLPDGYENVSPEYGGDARIDFYALELGQVIYRDGNQSIAVDAAAAAGTSPPYTTADGASRNSSSGFVLVNRFRLKYPVEMKQDVIHEFFHVLQYAHNRRAPFNGTDSHWFREASAVWAETFYFRSNSEEPHKRFATHFQPSAAGLADPNVDHQYAAYIWPFFMEQEKGESAVFQAWAAIDPLAAGNFAGMTEAISSQLSFDTSFREFAMRNLNINDVLQSAALKQYKTQDDFFYDDKPPTGIATGTIVPGTPYLSGQQSIPALAATYFKLGVAETSREVTISLAQYSPGSQVDGDAIVHVGGRWEHRPIVGGKLKFCRDDPPDDIDSLYVVVSNHGRPGAVAGFLEASAKKSCTQDAYLVGTISWTADDPDGLESRHSTVTGSASLVLHGGDASHIWEAERGGGSTYSYDIAVDECSPVGHLTGDVESGVGTIEPEWHIGIVNALGAASDLPGYEDLEMSISFYEEWEITCIDPGVTEGQYTTTVSAPFLSFPGCERAGSVTAKFDGVENYVVDCDVAVPGYGVTGHIQGTLHLVGVPPPTP